MVRFTEEDLKAAGFSKQNDGSWAALKTQIKHAPLIPPKTNKYSNKKTTIGDIKFDSKGEANRYSELKILEDAGEIFNLQLQPRFTMIVEGKKVCTYVADFQYEEYGSDMPVVEDFKGMETQVFKLKKKLFMALYGAKYELRMTKA